MFYTIPPVPTIYIGTGLAAKPCLLISLFVETRSSFLRGGSDFSYMLVNFLEAFSYYFCLFIEIAVYYKSWESISKSGLVCYYDSIGYDSCYCYYGGYYFYTDCWTVILLLPFYYVCSFEPYFIRLCKNYSNGESGKGNLF